MKHDELCARAVKWLKGSKGCSAAISELNAATPWGEIPDAIGFRSTYSILVECKTSRADFLSDKKKLFRERPDRGMGTYRFYMCPPGIIQVEDLPPRWGLLYVHDKKIQHVHGPLKSNTDYYDGEWQFDKCYKGEIALLVSALRRTTLP